MTEAKSDTFAPFSSDRPIVDLADALEQGSLTAISSCVAALVGSGDRTRMEAAVRALEKHLFFCKDYYLTCYLFQLYDRLGDETMARFYLQYCYEDLISQRKYPGLLEKYLNLKPGRIEGNYYEHDGEFDYTFENETKTYEVHSFSNEIGFNATLLKTPYGSLVFDCGAKFKGNYHAVIDWEDFRSFLGVYGVGARDVAAVMISHAHLDHYGSISSLIGAGIPQDRFYADPDTVAIIKNATGDPFTGWIRPISDFSFPEEKIRIRAYPNGHIPGSRLFVIRFDCVTVIYTGDFCLHDQHTVEGLNLDLLKRDAFIASGVSCLITESTCGRKVSGILSYAQAEKALKTIAARLLEEGYKIFLPVFAIGRSQELTMMMDGVHRILINEHSIRLTRLYEKLLHRKIVRPGIRYSTDGAEKAENFAFNDIVIVSAGMLTKNNLFAQYFDELRRLRQPVAIIRTGYSDSSEEAYGYSLFQGWKRNGGLLFDVPLSSHAGYDDLFVLMSSLQAENVVAVHGAGIIHNHGADKHGASARGPMRITDSDTRLTWKLAVVKGERALSSGRSLEESELFRSAFKHLIHCLKRSGEGEPILDILLSYDSIDELFSFLKSVYENKFSVKTAWTDTENP